MITIYELKRRNKANGGYFFDKETLKLWGDTLKGLHIKRGVDSSEVIVTRKATKNSWTFDVVTGRMKRPVRA